MPGWNDQPGIVLTIGRPNMGDGGGGTTSVSRHPGRVQTRSNDVPPD